MIKASSGGGGKGMRVSRSEEDFESNFLNAQMESVKGFSDNTMYIERFVENPRHIEFQILVTDTEMSSISASATARSREDTRKSLKSPRPRRSPMNSAKRWVRRRSARRKQSDMRMREPSSSFWINRKISISWK